MPESPDICPACGSPVPPNALCCPECGSDHDTGWSDHATSQRLGVPDDQDFDYDEFVKNEFGSPPPQLRPQGISWFWWIVAILLLAAFLALVL